MKPVVLWNGNTSQYPGYSCEQVTIVASRILDTIGAFLKHVTIYNYLCLFTRVYFLREAEESNEIFTQSVRFEIFTAMTMKYGVFWDITPRGSYENRRFEGTQRLFHSCHPDERGAKFLRNFGSYKSHKAYHPRRHHS
jgi:hypothetical protein